MKVVRKGDSAEVPATAPIFVGTVHSRPMITRDMDEAVTVTLVRFSDGGKNKRHTHTADQILYITEGNGIVASESYEHHVEAHGRAFGAIGATPPAATRRAGEADAAGLVEL